VAQAASGVDIEVRYGYSPCHKGTGTGAPASIRRGRPGGFPRGANGLLLREGTGHLRLCQGAERKLKWPVEIDTSLAL